MSFASFHSRCTARSGRPSQSNCIRLVNVVGSRKPLYMASLALIASMAWSHHSWEKNFTLSDTDFAFLATALPGLQGLHVRLPELHPHRDRVGERDGGAQQDP